MLQHITIMMSNIVFGDRRNDQANTQASMIVFIRLLFIHTSIVYIGQSHVIANYVCKVEKTASNKSFVCLCTMENFFKKVYLREV